MSKDERRIDWFWPWGFPCNLLISASASSLNKSDLLPQVTRRLSDGDMLDLGDRKFRVVHLPGHSPGSINLLDVGSDRSLFSGDVVYESESGNAGDEAWNNAFVHLLV